MRACTAVVLACAVFVVVCLAVFDSFEDERIMLGNLLFLVLLAGLLPLFWHEVNASRSCKTFVFLIAAVVGSIVPVAAFSLNMPLGFDAYDDGRLYRLSKLAVIAAVDIVAFPLGCLLMKRGIQPLVEGGLEARRWRNLCIIPLAKYSFAPVSSRPMASTGSPVHASLSYQPANT